MVNMTGYQEVEEEGMGQSEVLSETTTENFDKSLVNQTTITPLTTGSSFLAEEPSTTNTRVSAFSLEKTSIIIIIIMIT